MEIKDAVLQAINEVGLSLHIGEADEVVKLVEEKLTSTNTQRAAMQKHALQPFSKRYTK